LAKNLASDSKYTNLQQNILHRFCQKEKPTSWLVHNLNLKSFNLSDYLNLNSFKLSYYLIFNNSMEVDWGNLEALPLSLIFNKLVERMITSISAQYARIGIPWQSLIIKIVESKTMYCLC